MPSGWSSGERGQGNGVRHDFVNSRRGTGSDTILPILEFQSLAGRCSKPLGIWLAFVRKMFNRMPHARMHPIIQTPSLPPMNPVLSTDCLRSGCPDAVSKIHHRCLSVRHPVLLVCLAAIALYSSNAASQRQGPPPQPPGGDRHHGGRTRDQPAALVRRPNRGHADGGPATTGRGHSAATAVHRRQRYPNRRPTPSARTGCSAVSAHSHN